MTGAPLAPHADTAGIREASCFEGFLEKLQPHLTTVRTRRDTILAKLNEHNRSV